MAVTDPYFRGFDQGFPDYWRFKEWEREFDGFAAAGRRAGPDDGAPAARPHRRLRRGDRRHQRGRDGDRRQRLRRRPRRSTRWRTGPFAKDTLVFVVEDDAQDGPDHVDAHRSIAFVAGPYVKQGAVISRRYTTVDLVRTIEAVLGLEPMGLNDALAAADDGCVRRRPSRTGASIRSCPACCADHAAAAAAGRGENQLRGPARSGAYWRAAMKGQDFSSRGSSRHAALQSGAVARDEGRTRPIRRCGMGGI